MINCEWIYCEHNQMSRICSCNNVVLRCATSQDLIDEQIVGEETQVTRDNSGNVLMCDSYECMK